jgi:hypothetical protein
MELITHVPLFNLPFYMFTFILILFSHLPLSRAEVFSERRAHSYSDNKIVLNSVGTRFESGILSTLISFVFTSV